MVSILGLGRTNIRVGLEFSKAAGQVVWGFLCAIRVWSRGLLVAA